MKPVSQKIAAVLGWPELLDHLAGLCHTDRGAALARALPWLTSAEEVQDELTLVSEACALRDLAEPMPFGSVLDLDPALRRLEKEGALDAPNLTEVAQTLESGARLRSFLQARKEQAPGLARLAAKISPLSDISGPIRDAFDENGDLADHASPGLGRLRRKATELHRQLTRRMRALLDDPAITKYLQDRFYTQREDRYVLPVRTDTGSAVEGIVHGSSSSGQTFFVEPQELVGLNNQLKLAEMEVTREEVRIMMELSALVREEMSAINKNLELLERLDVVEARARLAISLDATPPRISTDGKTHLLGMRHPLMVLSNMEVVPNDIELWPDRALIITGPNAGGKTVCLKTVGICALMLRAGMHLPTAPDSSMPLYERVLTEMGDEQSLEQNLSTFTAHMGNLLDFLEAAKPGALILLDEVGVGTDPREGAALAQALLEGFVASGCQLAATTHFEQLKSLALADDRFTNASVGFDLDQMRPTYRLHAGVAGSSGALDVARRLGLEPRITQRAAELLEGGGQDLARLLTDLSGERTRLEQQRLELEKQAALAKGRQEEYQGKLQRLQQQEKKRFEGEYAGAINELKQARAELSRVRALLKRQPNQQRLQQADRQISGAARQVLSRQQRPEPEGRAAQEDELVPGLRVSIPQLGGVGEVIEAPCRGKVAVRVGGLRTQVPVKALRIPTPQTKKDKTKPPPSKPTSKPRPLPSSAPPREEALRTVDNTLDIRGFRVDEGLAELDRFLDRALRYEEQAVFVIHGHGTGALRSALRAHVVDLDHVRRFQPAGVQDGGDGVTIIWLK